MAYTAVSLERWGEAQQYLDNAKQLVRSYIPLNAAISNLISTLQAKLDIERGAFDEAVQVSKKRLNDIRKDNPDNWEGIALASNNLAQVYEELGQFNEAIKLYEAAITSYKKYGSEKTLAYTSAVINLGMAYSTILNMIKPRK